MVYAVRHCINHYIFAICSKKQYEMWILLFHGHFSNDTENENKSNPNINFKLMYMKQSMKSKGFERRLLLIMWGLFLSLSAFAQQISIKGHVVDAAGEPVIGASVVEESTTNGTITDIDGNFSLKVSPKSMLTVSFIGYATQTVPVNGKTSLTITLKEDTEVLDEVVVIGYGTMKKSDLTGAISSVSSKDLMKQPSPSLGAALQGRATGLQVISSGAPGDNVSMKIRGIGSINNSDPLLVIDGVPTDVPLNMINMDDVETVDVLKDASATAIYGSRGAYGVIIITTKKGKSDAAHFNFKASYGIEKAIRTLDLLDATQFASLHNEMMTANGQPQNPLFEDPTSLGRGTNWTDELFQTAATQNYSLNYSGGNDKTTYYVSAAYFNQEGIVRTTQYERYTVQFNMDTQMNNWLGRWEGYKAGVENWNKEHPDDQAKLSEPQYAGTSSEGGSKAAEALMSADPTLDALIPAGGGGDPLQGAIAAVERAGKTQDIDIVSTDFLPDLGERLENGSMAGESGGHYCDPLIAFMMVYNAIKGNYSGFEGKFEDVPFPYLYVSSADDYKAYEQYFVDQLPYTDEELVEMSELDLEGLKEAASKISIEDAAARAGK